MTRERPYMIVNHTMTPKRGIKTEIPGWMKNENVDVNEDVSFAFKIKNNTISTSSVIIDLLSKKLVKNRFGHLPNEEVVSYYFERYAKQISEVVVKYMMAYGRVPDAGTFTDDAKIAFKEIEGAV